MDNRVGIAKQGCESDLLLSKSPRAESFVGFLLVFLVLFFTLQVSHISLPNLGDIPSSVNSSLPQKSPAIEANQGFKLVSRASSNAKITNKSDDSAEKDFIHILSFSFLCQREENRRLIHSFICSFYAIYTHLKEILPRAPPTSFI